jgi:hypothetical protein
VNLRAESRLNFNAAVLARLRSQAIDLAVHPVSACHGLQGYITLAPPMARSAYPAENSGTAAAVCPCCAFAWRTQRRDLTWPARNCAQNFPRKDPPSFCRTRAVPTGARRAPAVQGMVPTDCCLFLFCSMIPSSRAISFLFCSIVLSARAMFCSRRWLVTTRK